MAKFVKHILDAGTYVVSTPSGERREENIPAQRVKNWVTKFKRMVEKGIRIPAPWAHDLNALPVVEGEGGFLSSSYENGGYWEDFWTEEDPNTGKTRLFGLVDIPRDADADKVGTTVTEVSPYVRPSWTDGTGETHEDSMMHVALVTHPIVPGQQNFQKVDSVPPQIRGLNSDAQNVGLALCLSNLVKPETSSEIFKKGFQMNNDNEKPKDDMDQGGDPQNRESSEKGGGSGDAAGADLNQVLGMLEEHGIKLPKDTNPENLLERLVIACGQKSHTEDGLGGDEELVDPTSQPPAGATSQQPSPVALSHTEKVLLSHLRQDKRNSYVRRINALLTSGRITKDYCDKNLRPLLDGFSMSFDQKTGDIKEGPLDMVIKSLENLPASQNLLGSQLSHGNDSVVEDIPYSTEAWGGQGEVSDERAEELANRLAAK